MLELTWFWLVALLVTMWSVMDGFDFGVGALHRVVARTDSERREVLASIGPVWDGNEVWLLAAGGSMFLAFPRLLAAGFSGLYLPVIFTVWGLILRGVSIELRSHLPSPLWRSFFDTTFVLASLVVPVLMGAALGNVMRGVPLDASGFFELDLFGTEGRPGALDGYTLVTGLSVLGTFIAHGANWLVWKTGGAVQARARAVRRFAWPVVVALWAVAAVMTARVAPEVFARFTGRPALWLVQALALAGAAWPLLKPQDERGPFFGGVAFIAGQLVVLVGSLFPVVLPATDGRHALTVTNAASAGTSMQAGLMWWGPGVLLAAGYLWWVLRHFRGKATAAADGEGY